MSDHWIIFVPEDPHLVPDSDKQLLARDRLAAIAPRADAVEAQSSEAVEFIDCGENFERISCPSCGSDIPLSWWQDRMDDDYGDGFKLSRYPLPCCSAAKALHELVYEWPQAFGRFSLEAMNPNIGTIDDKDKRQLEEILETKLIVVYRHL